MSLWDKIKCSSCAHWLIRHTGTHVKGTRTACCECPCRSFTDPDKEGD